MTLSRRFGLVFGVIAVLAVLLGLELAGALGRAHDARADTASRWAPATAAADGLLTHVVDQETGERGFVITGDTSYLAPYQQGRRATATDLAALERLLGTDPSLSELLGQVQQRLDQWQTQAAEPEIAARRSGEQAAAALVLSGHGKHLFDTLRGSVTTLQRRIADRTATARTAQERATRDLSRTLIAAAAVAVLAGLVLFVLVVRWVLVPISRLSAALRRVAGGELSAPVAIAGGVRDFVDVASDADAMRRRILVELESSEAARQALEQRGPVVVGLAQQLAPPDTGPIPGLRLAAVLRSAEGVLAGDWAEVFALDEHRVAVVVADVSGHGAEAGLEAVRLKHVITTALRLGHGPDEAVAMAAAGFAADERFATAVVVELDVGTGALRWTNAGHLAPRLVPQSGGSLAGVQLPALIPTGPLLSSLGGSWAVRRTTLRPGELLLAFTDGLTEARDAAEREFGWDGVCAALEAATIRDVDTVVSTCLAAVRAHAVNPHRDDITILALSRDLATAPVDALRTREEPVPTRD